ncbi:hypothetical protein [Halosegnis longus]|uniref:hypothetical protein n=1 Tax=Halosegnis longus TaxID=2216012 RepID=UPI00129D491C|nr:hypothetical protein [Halosegnis longus]
MTVSWIKITAFGSLLTILAAAPFLLGMGSVLSNASVQGADVEGVYRVMNLAVGALKTLVPLTAVGALVLAFFQFAGGMA